MGRTSMFCMLVSKNGENVSPEIFESNTLNNKQTQVA